MTSAHRTRLMRAQNNFSGAFPPVASLLRACTRTLVCCRSGKDDQRDIYQRMPAIRCLEVSLQLNRFSGAGRWPSIQVYRWLTDPFFLVPQQGTIGLVLDFLVDAASEHQNSKSMTCLLLPTGAVAAVPVAGCMVHHAERAIEKLSIFYATSHCRA